MFKSFKYKRISGGYIGKEEIDPGNSNNMGWDPMVNGLRCTYAIRTYHH
jgi:hypothetical protein